MDDLTGLEIMLFKNNEKGFISEHKYSTELNHFYFKIKTETDEFITFNRDEFEII